MAEKKPKEEEGEGEVVKEAAPASSIQKPILIGAAVAILILLAGIPVYLFVLKPAPVVEEQIGIAEDDEATLQGADQEPELAEGEQAIGAIFPLETFVVNLKGGGFIRTQLQIEFVTREIPVRFYARQIPVRDRIISLLADKARVDFDGAEGRDSLKRQVRDIVNDALKREEVKEVYLTQYTLQ